MFLVVGAGGGSRVKDIGGGEGGSFRNTCVGQNALLVIYSVFICRGGGHFLTRAEEGGWLVCTLQLQTRPKGSRKKQNKQNRLIMFPFINSCLYIHRSARSIFVIYLWWSI